MVATVLTACGIETIIEQEVGPYFFNCCNSAYRLRYWNGSWLQHKATLQEVATVLTACGIETLADNCIMVTGTDYLLQQCLPLAVLKLLSQKFTVIDISIKLQQCLPLAVLKHEETHTEVTPAPEELQQCLPLAVLKLVFHLTIKQKFQSCNSAYRLRYWNQVLGQEALQLLQSCNSAYRLRYWNTGVINHHHFLSWSCNSAYCLRYWN